MHSILVALTQPDTKDFSAVQRWNSAIDAIKQKIPPSAEVEVLAEGVLLIRASSGLAALGISVAFAERDHFPYRVLFIESATEWKREAVV